MAMHSNWNPWHGCIKCSEGCRNCYVYYLDRMRGKNGADVYKTKTGFRYPLAKDKNGKYRIQSGEMISVCMTSDFFLEEVYLSRKVDTKNVFRPKIFPAVDTNVIQIRMRERELELKYVPVSFFVKKTEKKG